jgi:hypothetical protein
LTELTVLSRGFDKIEARLALPIHFAGPAEGYGEFGEPEEGRTLVDEVLDFIEEPSAYPDESRVSPTQGTAIITANPIEFRRS